MSELYVLRKKMGDKRFYQWLRKAVRKAFEKSGLKGKVKKDGR